MRATRPYLLIGCLLLGGCASAPAPLTPVKQAEFDKLRTELGSGQTIRPGGRLDGRTVSCTLLDCPAILRLIRMSPQGARRVFAEATASEEAMLRLNGAVGLARMKDAAAAEPLRRIAADEQAGEAAQATALFHLARLGGEGDDRFFLDMLTTLHDPPLSANVTAAAIEGYAAWPQTADQEVIRDRLNDADEQVRIAAYAALTELAEGVIARAAAASLPAEPLAEQAAVDCQSANADLRLGAVRYAAACPAPEAMDILRAAIGDRDGAVREAAAEGLARFGAPSDAAALGELVGGGSLQSALGAVARLSRLGEPQALARCLSDERWQIRAAACKALTALGAQELLAVWDRIEPLAEDRSLMVRIAATEAAAATASPRVIAALCVLIQSPSAVVRGKALAAANGISGLQLHLPASATQRERDEAVARLTDWLKATHPALAAPPPFAAPKPLDDEKKKSLAALMARLAGGAPADRQMIEQLKALGPAAVFEMEDQRAGTPLWEKLADDVLPELDAAYAALKRVRRGEPATRRQGALALAAERERSAFSPRQRAEVISQLRVQEDYFVFRYLLAALQPPGEAGGEGETAKDEPLETALIACLDRRDDRICADAAAALGRRKGVAAADPLLQLLDGDRPTAAAAAADALGRIGQGRAVAPLIAKLTHRDAGLRLSAAEALERLGSTAGRVELVHQMFSHSAGQAEKAIAFVAEANCAWAVEHLVALLSGEDAATVDRAVEALRTLTGRQFGYDRLAPPAERGEAIARWQQWWASEGRPAPSADGRR